MRCIWDDVPTALGFYIEHQFPNFAALAKRLPCPSNPEQQQIADKLKKRVGSNMDLLGKLNDQLSDPAVRDRLVKLYNEDPAALNAAIDRVLDHPEQTADIIRSIPLKSEQPAPPPPQAQPKTPPKTETPAKPPVTTKPENTPPPLSQGSHHIENADNARLQAQMHMMGVYKGDINGSDKDTNVALKEYAKNHPELHITVTDKDLTPEQLKTVKDAVASDFDKWAHDKTNAQDLKDLVKAGYDVGALKPANDSVKEMQIAALALGGTLPRFGVDGIRGRETNKALRDIMGPDGMLTKILDAAGIAHEWPSAKTAEEKPAKPAATSAAVRSGETSIVTDYFNGRSGGEIDPGIYYNPDRRVPGQAPVMMA